MGAEAFIQPIFSSLIYICVLVLATFAITLIFKTSSTTNFAQGTIAAFGCYVTSHFLLEYGWNIWACLAIGILVGIACGLFIDLVIFRNGRSVNLVGKQIITMGIVALFGNIIPMIFTYLDAPDMPAFLEGSITIPIGSGVYISYHTLISMGITVVLIVGLFLLLRFSKWGLGVRTTSSNEFVAQMMGVNTYIITAVSWALAGGLGALAAVMFVGENGVMASPFFMTEFQVNAFLAGILGGFGTFFGPIVAAIAIPLFRVLLGYLVMIDGFEFITQWDMVIIYVVVMILIYIMPNGIFGKKEQVKV